MAFRVFHCEDCGHKMRLSGGVCGWCYHPKRTYQRLIAYVIGIVILLALALLVALT